jgi:hypothetical protein
MAEKRSATRRNRVSAPLTRRQLVMLGAFAIAAAATAGGLLVWETHPQPGPDTLVVHKRPTCNCCAKWIKHVEAAGFDVAVRNESSTDATRRELGVPRALGACHTAIIQGYVIEGHVPVQDIQRLLRERPPGKGLAVAGMPIGSPGMEQGERRDPYEVLLFQANGETSVFARHGASGP